MDNPIPSLEADLEAARGHPDRRRGAGEVLDEVNRRLRAQCEPGLTARNRRELFEDLVDQLAAGHQPEVLVQAIMRSPCRTPRAVDFELGKIRAGPARNSRDAEALAGARDFLEAHSDSVDRA